MTNPLRRKREQVLAAAQKGMHEGILAIETAAVGYAPKAETGHLRGSARVVPPALTVNGISALLAFDAIYARYQHENYGANFTTPGTGAGYLKRAGEEKQGELRNTIINHIKGALR